MEILHICTTDSFRAGCEDIPPSKCPICEHETLYLSWVDCRCDTCGAITMDATLGACLMAVREKLRLTRKQLGEVLGYSGKTIKKYEWTTPSKKYREKLEIFVRENYK